MRRSYIFSSLLIILILSLLIGCSDMTPTEKKTENTEWSDAPTQEQTEPTEELTEEPTEEPTKEPTEEPTELLTEVPTEMPTEPPRNYETAANVNILSKYIYYDYYIQDIPRAFDPKDDIYTTFNDDNPDYRDLEKKTIVIDPGHQSYRPFPKTDVWISPYLDPNTKDAWVYNHLTKFGATGVSTGVLESDITDIIAHKLKTELESRGYEVILTKDSPDVLMFGAQRAAVANQNNANLMISLHCDSYGGSDAAYVSGSLTQVPEVWEGYPDYQLAYQSKKAAKCILDAYANETGLKNRGIFEIDKSSMFTFCKVPVLLLEMGYLSNEKDEKKLIDEEFQVKIVTGISNGIDDYFSRLRSVND